MIISNQVLDQPDFLKNSVSYLRYKISKSNIRGIHSHAVWVSLVWLECFQNHSVEFTSRHWINYLCSSLLSTFTYRKAFFYLKSKNRTWRCIVDVAYWLFNDIFRQYSSCTWFIVKMQRKLKECLIWKTKKTQTKETTMQTFQHNSLWEKTVLASIFHLG